MIGQTTSVRGKSWITSYALGCASMLSTPVLLMLQLSVLLHGFPQQPSTFEAVASRLNAEGLRTLTPTQRGYTAAARPSRRRDYRTAATAADVIALLDTAGLAQAHIVGHDWGGTQAWGAAGLVSGPSRLADGSLDTSPGSIFQGVANQQTRLALLVHGAIPAAGAAGARCRAYAREVIAGQRPARRVCRSLRRRDERARRADRRTELVSRDSLLHATAAWQDQRAYHLIWGRNDLALARAAVELTADHVAGPYEVVELDAGHWLPETEPDAVAAGILARVRSTTS